MAELVIIGNGFDKAHGLKTDYKDFIQFIIEDCANNSSKYSDLYTHRSSRWVSYSQFMSLRTADLNELIAWPNTFFQLAIHQFKTSNNWCDFEHFYFKRLSEENGNFTGKPDKISNFLHYFFT